ncbi:hypothetical protein [Streptomyces camelliae]|uniref:Peptidase S8/S53 domain-containing protein n=1 Tax=Streptomyces camelliae TaxID=3004093 RepID=A0ABY7NTG2_9ACTN|nr:hypothetical protein [Streptomyces sp. HUAS 2-6]WBO61524.1 hypothetical protein O1G22_00860 [Streptomyces sp. HUAS 2-6]
MLDLEMASAACPQCHILLVKADDPELAHLATAVDTAVALGATEVSNSYGGTEAHDTTAYAKNYGHPGVAVVASSGESGYTVPTFPAAYSSVIAVGGTSLTHADNDRGRQETAWAGAGSGVCLAVCAYAMPKLRPSVRGHRRTDLHGGYVGPHATPLVVSHEHRTPRAADVSPSRCPASAKVRAGPRRSTVSTMQHAVGGSCLDSDASGRRTHADVAHRTGRLVFFSAGPAWRIPLANCIGDW